MLSGRSRRGDGGQLRADIIEPARQILAETGGFEGLTLRKVAHRVGIAATSIYLHFPDTEHLAETATEQTFADLTAAEAAAAAGISDPCEELLTRCRAYCHFGLDHPGHHRVMFQQALVPSLAATRVDTPGWRAFQVLVRAVEACQTAGGRHRGRRPIQAGVVSVGRRARPDIAPAQPTAVSIGRHRRARRPGCHRHLRTAQHTQPDNGWPNL